MKTKIITKKHSTRFAKELKKAKKGIVLYAPEILNQEIRNKLLDNMTGLNYSFFFFSQEFIESESGFIKKIRQNGGNITVLKAVGDSEIYRRFICIIDSKTLLTGNIEKSRYSEKIYSKITKAPEKILSVFDNLVIIRSLDRSTPFDAYSKLTARMKILSDVLAFVRFKINSNGLC